MSQISEKNMRHRGGDCDWIYSKAWLSNLRY